MPDQRAPNIRPGFNAVTPYLATPNVAQVIDFLERALGAEETFRMARDDDSVMHAEVRVMGDMIMLGEPQGDAFPAMPSNIYLYVDDSDAWFARAREAGGEVVMDIQTMTFSGQRYGAVRDPGGNVWWIATQIEDVSAEEEERRVRESEL